MFLSSINKYSNDINYVAVIPLSLDDLYKLIETHFKYNIEMLNDSHNFLAFLVTKFMCEIIKTSALIMTFVNKKTLNNKIIVHTIQKMYPEQINNIICAEIQNTILKLENSKYDVGDLDTTVNKKVSYEL